MRFYPPFLGAGIRIAHMTDDMRELVVEMKLHWWNANYVKTHYGGSLYSMADPFYMLMLLENLGRGYIVWDKAATIRFRKPGKGTVRAEFRLTQEQIDSLRAQADAQEKVEPTFTVQVRDEAGEVVAEVEKLLYIRRKER
jgi:hypothetical protein